jgi:hypothetical protein
LERRGARETEELKIKIREIETLKRAEEDKEELGYARKAGSGDGMKLSPSGPCRSSRMSTRP